MTEDVLNILATVPDNLKDAAKETLDKMSAHVAKHDGKHTWSREDFEIGCRLGRGKFGRVYLARDVHAHLIYALKLMHKSEIVKNQCQRQVAREIEIQSRLKHPNILQMYTYFDDPRFIYFVLEYAAGGEMYDHLKSQPDSRFTPAKASKYFYQVVEALNYCHKKKVIHRDIKPENILLSGEDNVKLSDFGWSVHAPASTRRTMCGTLDYLPPEMVNHTSYHAGVDNWCVGVLLFEFLTGKPPFETKSTQSTYMKITSLDYSFPSYVPKGGQDLIQKLLQIDPKKRMSLPDAQRHFWITEHYPESLRSTEM